MSLQSNAYRHFRAAVVFSLLLSGAIALFVYQYGKNDSFLIINGWNRPSLDYLFTYLTYLGDGIIWVPLFVYILI
ncbi:MAG TPA: hypothetical protein VHK69_05225, partial [Chitinophagaceae bacterium]|nr:hypothetical protein [Chitinophagaceae bacterium]